MSVPPSRAGSPSHGHDRAASIVLIGMRGVGKTTLGTIAAKALGWSFLDTDIIFEQRQRVSVAHFIHSRGWEDFRRIESEILHDVLPANSKGKVIACGGGIVEVERNRDLLKRFREYGLVIHVLREKEPVLAYLQSSSVYPPLVHETAREAWDRREKHFRECCSYEFVSLTVPIPPTPQGFQGIITPDQTFALKPVEQDFFRLLRFIHGVDTNKVSRVGGPRRSYMLSLTFDDIRRAVPVLEDLSLGIDVWELRADLLAEWEPTFLSFQVATLRHHSTLPILLTYRTRSHGGKYPDITPEDRTTVERHAFLLHHGVRLGIEYVDVQFTSPESTIRYLMQNKGNTSIHLSYTDWNGKINWSHPQTRVLYERIRAWNPDLMMMVGMAKTFEDNMALRQFVGGVERERRQNSNGHSLNLTPPLIAINMGPEGKISRVLNPTLSPLSHPLLPRPAAPGQVSFYEAQTILYLTGLLPPKRYFLFGNPISHSMSPTIHNVAFQALGLPHTYESMEFLTIEELGAFLQELLQMSGGTGTPGGGGGGFGGASVTIPFKEGIMKYLGHVTKHARVIGAVNVITAIPHPGPNDQIGGYTLSGDNTDWRAIKTCLQQSLTPSNIITHETTALVLGAGGTARATLYALYQIGVVRIWLWNRTKSRADGLKEEFEKVDAGRMLRIRVVSHLDELLRDGGEQEEEEGSRGGWFLPTMIVSTIPATSAGALSSSTPIHTNLPSIALSSHALIDVGLKLDHLSDAGGVAIELGYERRITNLLKLAKEKRERGVWWAGVEGIDVLLEQAYEQFRIWTGRRAPRSKVRERVIREYEGIWRRGDED
ncbi:aldolase [Dendrothele bispora CBS 962.96]|uniref:shikimate kinase n=1 Tax=Dendrothele bispora (strain CBS 962.96) TaxID=1314807 RepID=A0A4V4HE04_DENBC|nr:aldolase [Dendrothele bispora CBS 962.96]